MLIVTASSAFSWAARDYDEHIITDYKHCETVYEIRQSQTTFACQDSIRTKSNFKFVAVGGFISDDLKILPSNNMIPVKVEYVQAKIDTAAIYKSIEMRKVMAMEKQAESLGDMALMMKMSVAISVMWSAVVVILFLK